MNPLLSISLFTLVPLIQSAHSKTSLGWITLLECISIKMQMRI